MNLPIAVWMLRSFMLDAPGEILEAARLDGADTTQELRRVLLPVIARSLARRYLVRGFDARGGEVRT